MIIDNGVVVYAWGDLRKRHNLYSVRKSLLSATYGLYVDKQKIDINATLKDLNITDRDGLSDFELQAKTSDLLKSRSGVYLKAAYESKSKDLIRPKRESYAPNEHFFYSNWDFNALLTIFEQETEKSFFKVFKKEIAEPIDMQSFRKKDMRYFFDKTRSNHPAYLFKMSTLDLGRFGLLMLNQGKWDDKQIISKEWVDKSTQRYTHFKKGFCDGYGYMWWLQDEKFCARGYWGQWLIVDPKRDIVIVHLTEKKGKRNKVTTKQFKRLMSKIFSAKK